MSNSILLEKFKTILLVVLFILTVLLSYFYWKDSTFSDIADNVSLHFGSSSFVSEEIPQPTDFICPESVDINFGNGTYTGINSGTEGLWKDFISAYTISAGKNTITIEEISQAQWSDTMRFRSIQFNFEAGLPLEYIKLYGKVSFANSGIVEGFNTAAWSEAFGNCIFLMDKESGRYYRLISDSEFDGMACLSEENVTPSGQYYPMNMMLGGSSDILVPFNLTSGMPELKEERNNIPDMDSWEKDLASAFFGEGLDFIRKIKDNSGTIIYMYGYGDITLTVYPDGSFEYQSTPSEEEDVGYNEALSTALSFVAAHGTWSSYGGKTLDCALIDVSTEVSGKNTIYTMTFRPVTDSLRLYDDTGLITVKVCGSDVVYYSRNVYITSSQELNSSEKHESSDTPVSFVGIITQNYSDIYDAVCSSPYFKENGSDRFDSVVNNISSVETGYFRSEDSVYIPAYILNISDLRFWYSMKDGQLLGSALITEV